MSASHQLFIQERVCLTAEGARLYPEFNKSVGQVVAERRHPYHGRCLVVRFFSLMPTWVYIQPTLLESAEQK